MYNIKMKWLLTALLPLQLWSQEAVKQPAVVPVLPLDSVLGQIDRNNLLLQTYDLRAQSYRYRAEAATAWMAPMVGAGTFMTPYPFQKVMEDRDKGALMLRVEQEIPNRSKQAARKRSIESLGAVEAANRAVSLNDFKAQARRLYYSWLVAEQRLKVLQRNERIMTTMKKVEEVRYPYNQSQLGNVYKIDARIEENRNMMRMQEGEIARARGYLNSLMNRPGNEVFTVDTGNVPRFVPALHDTAALASARGDVLKMNQSIRAMGLSIESMRQERKPDFKVQFDHMNAFDPMMPRSFSVMGMISIPIVPWASRMYKSEVRSMQLDVEAMEKERAAMLQETQGMLYGMQAEIQAMQKRIDGLEAKVIPAMQKSLDVNFINYQENKLPAPVVIDAWEALNMLQMNLLDEKLKLYQMIVDYEKELYR